MIQQVECEVHFLAFADLFVCGSVHAHICLSERYVRASEDLPFTDPMKAPPNRFPESSISEANL